LDWTSSYFSSLVSDASTSVDDTDDSAKQFIRIDEINDVQLSIKDYCHVACGSQTYVLREFSAEGLRCFDQCVILLNFIPQLRKATFMGSCGREGKKVRYI
jgi:hypothetical protein